MIVDCRLRYLMTLYTCVVVVDYGELIWLVLVMSHVVHNLNFPRVAHNLNSANLNLPRAFVNLDRMKYFRMLSFRKIKRQIETKWAILASASGGLSRAERSACAGGFC